MPKQPSFKGFYINFIIIDVFIWFVIVPAIISLKLYNEIFSVDAPTIQTYIWWQALGFASTWIAYHFATYETKLQKKLGY